MQRIVDRTVPTPVEVRVPQTVPVPVPVECVRYRDVPTIQEQIVEKVVTVPVPLMRLMEVDADTPAAPAACVYSSLWTF